MLSKLLCCDVYRHRLPWNCTLQFLCWAFEDARASLYITGEKRDNVEVDVCCILQDFVTHRLLLKSQVGKIMEDILLG